MIITFARQYGSGGRDIGLKLAELLNYRFYDREILELAAENSSIHPDIAKRFDEKPASSLLYSAFMAAGGMDERQIPLNQKLALAQFQVIRDLASEGSCIFVGRCADFVLGECSQVVNVLNVFVRAGMDFRTERAMKDYELPDAEARKLILKTDKIRARYYNGHTGREWGSAGNYNLIVDTSVLGIDGAASVIEAALKVVSKGQA